jgi:D-proline reductase (dithiol) PrdB
MSKSVDSFRFISGITRRMIKTWIGMEEPRPIPWTPLTKPLSECTVALLSSAGIALKTDTPFDQERERRNPWWGDPTYRRLPKDAS